MTRVAIWLLLVALLLGGLLLPVPGCQPSPPAPAYVPPAAEPVTTDSWTTKLTILHTNDTHACLDDVGRRATIVKRIQSEVGKANMLLLDGGDVFSGTPYFTLYKGQADLWFMNNMGYDAMCLGNHEFDKGPKVLADFVNRANFQVIDANLDFSNEPTLAGRIQPWIIVSRGGELYGIFGLTTEEVGELSSPGPSIAINEHTSTARQAVAALQQRGINKIIAVTHIGWDEDIKLAREVDGIDIVVGGHSHTVPDIYPTLVADDNTPTLVLQAGAQNKYLGRLNAEFNKAGILQSWGGSKLMPIDRQIEEDPDCAGKLAGYKAPIQQMMNNIVGRTTVDLDGDRDRVRTQETNLGNLIADAMLTKASHVGANIAIVNGGAIRASVPAGDISLERIFAVLPFGNFLVLSELSGKQVAAALENGVSRVEDKEGRFPQVAGIRFTWDPAAKPGSRVRSVEVKTTAGYQPIDSQTIYKVVTSDYLAGGGDGYTIFKETTNLIYLGFPDYETLQEYVTANSPLNYQIEERIRRISGIQTTTRN